MRSTIISGWNARGGPCLPVSRLSRVILSSAGCAGLKGDSGSDAWCIRDPFTAWLGCTVAGRPHHLASGASGGVCGCGPRDEASLVRALAMIITFFSSMETLYSKCRNEWELKGLWHVPKYFRNIKRQSLTPNNQLQTPENLWII